MDSTLRNELYELKEQVKALVLKDSQNSDIIKKAQIKEKKMKRVLDNSKQCVMDAESREKVTRTEFEDYMANTTDLLEKAGKLPRFIIQDL